MSKDKKKKDEVGTSLRGLLKTARVEPEKKPEAPKAEPRPNPKPMPVPASGRPSDGLRGNDKIAFNDAMLGVRPIEKTPLFTPTPKPPPAKPITTAPSDEEARARLGALVAGAVRFDLDRDGDRLRGVR